MRALLVLNPAAGGGRGVRLLPEVIERLRSAHVEVEVHRTTSLDDAGQAAEEAAGGVDAVVAVGGDGTVGACAAGLAAARDGRAVLGIVPAGGGNDLARNLGLPFRDPLAAAALLPSLEVRRADLARVGERCFFNAAGAGFDSEVSRRANQCLSTAPARLRYVGAVLAELVVGRLASFRLCLDGRELSARGWLVEPDFVATFPKVFSGRHVEHPDVTVHRATRIELEADRPLPVHVDGEPAGTVPATFEVVPGAVAVLAAAGAPALSPRSVP